MKIVSVLSIKSFITDVLKRSSKQNNILNDFSSPSPSSCFYFSDDDYVLFMSHYNTQT